MSMQMQPIMVRVSKAQQVFGVHRATIYRWAGAGSIKIYKCGSASFVKTEEILAHITGEGAA